MMRGPLSSPFSIRLLELHDARARAAAGHQRRVAGFEELLHPRGRLLLEPLLGVAADDVAMGVDEARHHGHALGVDRRSAGGVRGRRARPRRCVAVRAPPRAALDRVAAPSRIRALVITRSCAQAACCHPGPPRAARSHSPAAMFVRSSHPPARPAFVSPRDCSPGAALAGAHGGHGVRLKPETRDLTPLAR